MPDTNFVVYFIVVYFTSEIRCFSARVATRAWRGPIVPQDGHYMKDVKLQNSQQHEGCFWNSELSGLLWKKKDAFLSSSVLQQEWQGLPQCLCCCGNGRQSQRAGEGKSRSLNSLQFLGADSFRTFDLAPKLDYFWLLQLIFEVYFYLLLISMKLKARMVSWWGTVSELYSRRSACTHCTVLLIVLFQILLARILLLYSNDYQSSS